MESKAFTTLSHVFLATAVGIPLSFFCPTFVVLSHVTWSCCVASASVTCWVFWIETAGLPDVPPTHPVISYPVTSIPDLTHPLRGKTFQV